MLFSSQVPRPNLYVCINPVQVTFYQDTFLWFIKFVIKMALTLKMGEQEGKQSQKKVCVYINNYGTVLWIIRTMLWETVLIISYEKVSVVRT